MNQSAFLAKHVLERIQTLEPTTEIGCESAPFHVLTHPQTGGQVGHIRAFKGSDIIDRVLYIELNVPSMNMVAYMVSAFTKSGSLYPHLVFDSELLPEDAAFHIDLIHKKEFSTDTQYINSVMAPLSDAFLWANNNDNFRPSEATLLMKALLNPWMASFHCQPEYLPDSKGVIDAYLDHWLSLKQGSANAVELNTTEDTAVAAYDKAHRKALYDPQVDLLWDFISNIIGSQSRDLILALCQGEIGLD